MTAGAGRDRQGEFAAAVAGLLRQSRRRQRLTQSEVADRTGGTISKASLANYEAGHRSLRVEVFWAIAKALGEDPGAILLAAERASGYGAAADEGPVTVDIHAIEASADPRFAPVRRWFAMRLRAGGARLAVRTITLDPAAVAALAELMRMPVAECRRILAAAGGAASPAAGGSAVTASASPVVAVGVVTGVGAVTGVAGVTGLPTADSAREAS